MKKSFVYYWYHKATGKRGVGKILCVPSFFETWIAKWNVLGASLGDKGWEYSSSPML